MGDLRLFALSIVHLLEHAHISSVISMDDIVSHEARARSMLEEMEQQIETSQRRRTMEVGNKQRLNQGIQSYYIYSLVEMGVVIGCCVLQLRLIEKLLNPGSVV